MSCSRETCFSAFSCRRAPTKSRLMSFVLLYASTSVENPVTAEKKRGGHPRPEAADYVQRSIHPTSGTVERPPRADAVAELRGGSRRVRVRRRSGPPAPG